MNLPEARTTLAFGITIGSVVGITILSTVSILDDSDPEDILNLVLPLFGTWVGTVLAYYFSRDNFEVAADKTKALLQLSMEEKLGSIPVLTAMSKPVWGIRDKTRNVHDFLNSLEGLEPDDKLPNFKWIPILSQSGVLEALFYREDLYKYRDSLSGPGREFIAFEDLINRKDLLKVPAFVSENATLADAKNAMSRKDCDVVLVTRSGDKNDPVIGLITNTDIAEHSRA